MARSRAAPAPARSASSAAARPKPAASPAPAAPAAPAHAAPASHSYQAPPQHHAPPPPAPAPVSAPPPAAAPQQSSGGGIMSGLMGAVVQGAAVGTGSALAHRAIDSMFGGRGESSAPAPAAAPQVIQVPAAEGPCSNHIKAFAECMSKNNGDMGMCQFYFDAMQQCKMMA